MAGFFRFLTVVASSRHIKEFEVTNHFVFCSGMSKFHKKLAHKCVKDS